MQSQVQNSSLREIVVFPPLSKKSSSLLEIAVVPVFVVDVVRDELVIVLRGVVSGVECGGAEVFICDWGSEIVYPVNLLVKSCNKPEYLL